jgi:AraC family transcriptional regulator
MTDKAIIQEPAVVSFPGMRLAGLICNTTTRYGENYRDIPEFWKSYLQSGAVRKLHSEPFVKDHTEYGVCFPKDRWTGKIEYFLGVQAAEGNEVPPEYEIRRLPPAVYRVFSSVPSDNSNFPKAIFNEWAFIFGEWLPQSGREVDGRFPQFERYDKRVFGSTGKVCEIYIPLWGD